MSTPISSPSTSAPPISFGGLVSGLNTNQIIQALMAANQAPMLLLVQQQNTEQSRLNAWQDVNTKLQSLQSAADSLGLQGTVNARTLSFGGPSGTFASGTATSSAAAGSFQLQIDQLATATTVSSTAGVGGAITGSDIVTLSNKLSTPVTAGTFTVNGSTVNVSVGEDFNSVLAGISTATGGAVTGSVVGNSIQLTSHNGQPIALGSAGDSSNFLSVVKLLGQPSATTMTSAGPVGVANPNAVLDSANVSGLLSTTSGSLVINGVSISYDTTKDSLNAVLNRINASAAGVSATYNSTSDTVTFTSAKTGNLDVSLADGAGNLLSKLHVLAATTSSGNVGGPIVGTDDATTTTKVPTPVSAGTFTVDGATVTVSAGDTWSTILAAINTQTAGAVSGSIVGDTIQLTSGSAITLGNAGDTSNFLTVAKLASVPSATTMTSSGPIGVANSTVAMDSGNLNGLTSTTTGALVVNGVTVNYNTTTDSLATVLQRINSSGAGVVATYNSSTDQVSITSPNGGVSLSDTAGNLVSVLKVATSLASAHHLGNSAKYEVNGGPSQYSLTNTVNNLVPGVNVTLQAATPAGSPLTVSVNLDTSAGSKAVQSFVDAYNAVMDLISKDTAFDSQTKKAGIFLGDPTISIIQQQLQEGLFVSNGTALGLTPPFQDVSTIGLSTGAIGSKPGTTTELQFDSNAFQSALTSNPAAVTQLVNTVMGNLSKQLNATTKPFGPIDTAIQSETNQIIDIQHEIDSQNDILQQQQQALTDEFTQLDQSLAQIQSQSSVGAAVLAGLAGGTTSSSSGSSSTGSSSSTTG